MTKRAFEAKGDFDGATTSLPDGSLVNISERLANNDGRIETTDGQLADALAGHPSLKEVPVEDPKPAIKTGKPGSKEA